MANYNVRLDTCGVELAPIVVGVLFPVNEGDVIEFIIGEDRVCGTIIDETVTESTYIALNVYNSCEECNNPPEPIPPRSAGTEVFICEVCCECGATGTTINQIAPPHPVWTDGYGTPVTQLNMIVLGGPNGLNN